jgi:8-amino-7-oxononanoate synthase
MKEEFLHHKLQDRVNRNALRQLRLPTGKIDFCSNDYLGIVTKNLLQNKKGTIDTDFLQHGSTGSRLLSGNYQLIEETEKYVASFHEAEAGLIFNSGYDANLGLLSCIAGKGDTILYDFLCHASIRDGIRLSFAQSWSFQHNDLYDLKKKLQQATGNLFVVTESVFSMDGEHSPLMELADLCNISGAQLIVDEAHATGIIGEHGEGLVQRLGLQSKCFARVHTFGKALGCHGAIILGSEALRNYLINFCRPFIYSTALPSISSFAIRTAYDIFPYMHQERKHLESIIQEFQSAPQMYQKLSSKTPIQGIIVPGNDQVKEIAERCQQNNLDIRPILYPTVQKGSERLRIVLHAFNTDSEVKQLIRILGESALYK